MPISFRDRNVTGCRERAPVQVVHHWVMKQFLFGLSLSLAFIIGCATATIAQSSAVPPAQASQANQRWEYSCPGVSEEVVANLNARGAEGWEVINTTDIFCFRRPLT